MADDEIIMAHDVETYGACLSKHQMPVFATCMVNKTACQVIKGFKTVMPVMADRTREERCMNEFWLKQKPELMQVMNKQSEEQTLSTREVMQNFVQQVRDCAEPWNGKFENVFDTAGYDWAFISEFLTEEECYAMNYLREEYEVDEESNTKKRTRKPKYTSGVDVGSIIDFLGEPLAGKIKGGSFKRACMALKVPVPKWPMKHDHDPINDAAVIGLKYAYLCAAQEGRVKVIDNHICFIRPCDLTSQTVEFYRHSYEIQDEYEQQ